MFPMSSAAVRKASCLLVLLDAQYLFSTAQVGYTHTNNLCYRRNKAGEQRHNRCKSGWQGKRQREKTHDCCFTDTQSTWSNETHKPNVPCKRINTNTYRQSNKRSIRPER